MSFQERKLKAKDGYELSLRIYDTDGPKAVVMIIHGMEEHQDRYRPFAEYLQAAGYAVVTADMRGHGGNAPKLCHIADRDGHLRLLEDEEVILGEIHEHRAGVPVILFAFSMGTIIARAFLQKRSREFHKVVLCGYPKPNKAAGFGCVLADVLSSFKGTTGYSGLLDGMVLGPFIKAVPKGGTPQDWLSYNKDNIRKYNRDPLCGAPFTIGSYSALFNLIRLMNDPGKYEDVRQDLPILLISGRDDPCTGGEKGRTDSVNVLKQAGFRNLQVVTFDGMRHEILNENGREEVCKTILDFFDKA